MLTQDYQFSIDGVAFGMGMPVHCDAEGFQPGDADLETSMTNQPTSHGATPGRDRRRSAVWAFDLFANGTDPATALRATADLRNAWWNEDIEDTPGAVSTLRYRIAGRTRVVFGRGRRWTPSLGNRIINGYLPITADFEVMYPATYSDTEQSVAVSANASNRAIAGIQAPLTSPLLGVGGGEPQEASINIGGETDTWILLEFRGGIDPWVEIGNIRYQLDGSIGTNEIVTADPRPWSRGLVSNAGGSFGATRTSRLSMLKLKPGRYDVKYGNLDYGTSSTVTIRWRDAYKSL